MNRKPPAMKKTARKPMPPFGKGPQGMRGMAAKLPGMKSGGKKC